jgi:hypothetical protein
MVIQFGKQIMADDVTSGTGSENQIGKKADDVVWKGLVGLPLVFVSQYLNFDRLTSSPLTKSRCVNPLFSHFFSN